MEQAVVQKAARVITSMRAMIQLLRVGLYQEVGVMGRVMDELCEDSIILAHAVQIAECTPLHIEYLEAFYQLEFDNPVTPMASSQKRSLVPRRKIHAALAAIPESPINRSDAQELRRTLSKAHSGYVHATSEHILEVYGGAPRRFHIEGMLGTPRQKEFERYSLHFFYRGLITIMYSVLAFREEQALNRLYAFRESFEKMAGMTDWPDPDKRVRDLSRRGE